MTYLVEGNRQPRQTMAIPPWEDEFVHLTFLGDTFIARVAESDSPVADSVATCRSVRPQKLCSCGFYWLEWFTEETS